MKKLVSSAGQLAGLLAGLFGFVIAAAWIFQIRVIGQLIPGSAQMGINAPLLLMAAGFCCYFALAGRRRRALDLAWRGAAALVVLLPLLVLSQHLTGASLGIDFTRVPVLPTPGTPHPGRMAPNTCVAFVLAGVALHLARYCRAGRGCLLALSGCALLVLLIGLSALLGHFLRLEAMYRVASSNVMLPSTAAGLTVLGIGLWSLRGALLPPRRPAVSSERRITLRALGVLTLVAVSAGAAGFAAMRDSYEQSLAASMMFAATTSAGMITTTLDGNRRVIEGLAAGSDLGNVFPAPGERANRALLDEAARSMVRGGADSVRFYDSRGALLAGAGRVAAPDAGVRHPLLLDGRPATLMWEHGYVLSIEQAVTRGGIALGRVVAERRAHLLDRMLGSLRSAGTSDILVCHRAADAALCAPTRFYTAPLSIPMFKADATLNLPISHALAGRSGVAMVADLRGKRVLAAYTPVEGLGLGLVVKNDVDTLYAPLRERANMLVVALVLLVALGASALLFQVRPLLAQLVREQRRIRILLENCNDAFVAIGVDGRITDWNTEAERTFGWSAQEALGRDLAGLIIPPEQRQAHNEGFARFAVTGGGKLINSRIEVNALRRDGRLIPVELSIAGFHNGEGYVANAFMRDITERRRLSDEVAARARELELERDRAEAANRAKSEFVANMSHELRTPMNAVLGMAHLLGNTELKTEQKKYVEMIRDAGRSLLGIMNDILDFSKVEAGRMELEEGRFLLCDVLGAVATIMSVNAGDKDLELAIGVDPGVPQVLVGDAMRLQQVLVNLVGNAIKFTARGEVALRVAVAAREGERVELRISVRDTGIGIDAQQQERLFSPFTQGDSSTTRRFGGTGLGLAISRHLVRLMGGEIGFDSTVGQGTEFRVTLPLRVEAEEDDSRKLDPAMRGLRLLVVDDNATSRDCIARTAEGRGWEVACAESGERALALVREAANGPRRFDVILLDWQMPGMDGVRTMEAIRNVAGRGRLPVALMVNAYGRGKLTESPLSNRADAIISKPVTASILFDTLREILVERVRGPGRDSATEPANALARLDGARLLLAEDNELNQAVARGILEQSGAQVDIVGNGELAIQALAARPGGYDLVLMDIQMPVMDGFAATRHIRAVLGLTLPILAMTAGVTEPERDSYIAAGMDDLVAKPIDVDQMVATIARYLNRRQRFGPQPAPAAAPPPLPPPGPPKPLPVLDIGPLAAIARGNRERLGGLARLLQRVIDEAGRDFEEAQRCWRAGDSAQAARLLHGLRGGVGSVGAKRFARASVLLEQAIKGGADGVEQLFGHAETELAEALDAARAWLRDYEAPATAPAAPPE